MKIELPDFAAARVLVVGDVMLDRYWHGPTRRISPEAPVPVVKVEHIEERPGGAANVALNVATLGAGSCLLGLTGDDESANSLQKNMEGVRVDCDFVRLADFPTITKLRILSRNQQLIRLDFEEGFELSDSKALLAKMKTHLAESNVVIFSDYAKGALRDIQTMIALCREAGVSVLVDPKGTDFARYKGATLLTPNMSEFEAVVGKVNHEDELVARGREVIRQHDLQALLVTRSEHGMTLIRADGDELHMPAQAQEVFDVTGAGDTVIATLGSALAAGSTLEDACALANVAAGIVVGKLGTSTTSVLELARVVEGAQESGFGAVSENQLTYAVAAAHRRGEKVVMTNGCFDILHAGHVSYLEAAKRLGDRLIVAVNDDASVSRLKGSGRPVNPVERRMAVLAGLASVDWVVPFCEDTPQRLISEILPDCLVKGGDYEVEQIAGHQEVLANGGEVKVLHFEEGCSTSAIIRSLQRNL